MNIKEFIENYDKPISWDKDFNRVRIDDQISESLTNGLLFSINFTNQKTS